MADNGVARYRVAALSEIHHHPFRATNGQGTGFFAGSL